VDLLSKCLSILLKPNYIVKKWIICMVIQFIISHNFNGLFSNCPFTWSLNVFAMNSNELVELLITYISSYVSDRIKKQNIWKHYETKRSGTKHLSKPRPYLDLYSSTLMLQLSRTGKSMAEDPKVLPCFMVSGSREEL